MKQKYKKILAGSLVALGVLVLSGTFHGFEVLKSLNLKLSNGLYGGREVSDRIVIVQNNGYLPNCC